MARIFEVVPVTTTEIQIPPDGGSVERDLGVVYAIGEDAEQALDLILQPYGQFGGWYLDKIQTRGWPGPWAFVALRRGYDIATYIGSQFNFTIYDGRNVGVRPPKVACFIFPSKNSVAAVAEKIRFLRPAWALLQDKAVEQKWFVWLDEEPLDVMSEAASYKKEGKRN